MERMVVRDDGEDGDFPSPLETFPPVSAAQQLEPC